jgi:hypothetical protein
MLGQLIKSLDTDDQLFNLLHVFFLNEGNANTTTKAKLKRLKIREYTNIYIALLNIYIYSLK